MVSTVLRNIGGTRLVSLNNLYLETGWDKLKNRREMHRLVYFYKMKNNISPQYLSDLVLDSINSIHSHSTRHSSRLFNETNRVPPVTILAASICTFSILSTR
jgi:hypothetical protein